MCAYIFWHLYLHTCIHTDRQTNMQVYIRTYTNRLTPTHAHTHTHTRIYTHAYSHIYTYVEVYTYRCIFICISNQVPGLALQTGCRTRTRTVCFAEHAPESPRSTYSKHQTIRPQHRPCGPECLISALAQGPASSWPERRGSILLVQRIPTWRNATVSLAAGALHRAAAAGLNAAFCIQIPVSFIGFLKPEALKL